MNKLTKNTAEKINDLIEVNNDRFEGYDTASKETEEIDLKNLFDEMSTISKKFRDDLTDLLKRFNGEVPNTISTSISGKLYRVWMEIKSALIGKERGEILNSSDLEEDSALEAYDKALKENELPFEIKSVVEKQRRELQMYHDKIKSLREVAK